MWPGNRGRAGCIKAIAALIAEFTAQMNLEAGTLKIPEIFFAIIRLIGFLLFSRLEMNCFVVPSIAASSG